MAMSRTARILIAILLLAAAAFFWVNFYTQSRTADALPPADPVVAADVVQTTPSEADGDAASVAPEQAAGGGADVGDADLVSGEADADATAPDDTPRSIDVDPAPLVVAPASDAPPTVVVDAPMAVGREIVIADLPFLITEPRPVDDGATEALVVEGTVVQGVTTPTRATVNPFSPVVVRTPPAPEREVPDTASVVGEVAVPAGPTAAEVAAAAAAVRADAPTPRAITPGSPAVTSALRPLPSGSVLSATPELLRETRVGSVAEEVDFANVTAIAVPDAEPADLAPSETAPAQAGAPDEVEPLTGTPARTDAAPSDPSQTDPTPTEATTETPSTVVTPRPPLAAGATQLARFLRDQNFAFTGSVLGPVGVGVFRSDLDPAPVVVVLGQTLPDTEIVLTDLRGQQAELRLGDSTQILTLDLRR